MSYSKPSKNTVFKSLHQAPPAARWNQLAKAIFEDVFDCCPNAVFNPYYVVDTETPQLYLYVIALHNVFLGVVKRLFLSPTWRSTFGLVEQDFEPLVLNCTYEQVRTWLLNEVWIFFYPFFSTKSLTVVVQMDETPVSSALDSPSGQHAPASLPALWEVAVTIPSGISGYTIVANAINSLEEGDRYGFLRMAHCFLVSNKPTNVQAKWRARMSRRHAILTGQDEHAKRMLPLAHLWVHLLLENDFVATTASFYNALDKPLARELFATQEQHNAAMPEEFHYLDLSERVFDPEHNPSLMTPNFAQKHVLNFLPFFELDG